MNYLGFKTQKDLKTSVQKILASYPLDQPFFNLLIQRLISENHYYCAIKPLVPLEFRKRPPAPGYKPYAFEARFPDPIGWKSVSWTKCCAPHRMEDEVAAGVRRAVAPQTAAYRRKHTQCETCGQPTTEVDHHKPEFKELLLPVLPEALGEAIRTFDWDSREPWTPDPASSWMTKFMAAHDQCELRALCKECHLAAAKNRLANRKAGPG